MSSIKELAKLLLDGSDINNVDNSPILVDVVDDKLIRAVTIHIGGQIYNVSCNALYDCVIYIYCVNCMSLRIL